MCGRLRAKVKRLVWRIYALCCAAISYWEIRRLALDSGGRLYIVALVEHMGDIVACLPVASELKRRNPDARIIWIAHRAYADLLIGNPNLSKIIPQACLGQWILLKRILPTIDVSIVDLHLHGKPCAKTKLVLQKPGQQRNVNTENYYQFGSLLRSFTLGAGMPYPADPQPNLFYAVERNLGNVEVPPKPYIVMHTQSNEVQRNWTAKKFSLLASTLIATGFDVVEVGHTSIIEQKSRRFHLYSGGHSLNSYAVLIASASLFIGVDSGFAHVANALGVRGVVILGSYRAFPSYTPYSGSYENKTTCSIVRAGGLPASEVSVDAVIAAALDSLQDSKDQKICPFAHPQSRSAS